MKKHLIIAGIICAATIPPVYAVTKCVKLTSSTTCTNTSGSGSNWYVTCGGIAIQGVAFCGSKGGGSTGTKSRTVTTSATSDDNKHCWCKMVSPAVSSWVFNYWFTPAPSAGNCAYNCATRCATGARDSSAFRAGLFSEFSD